MKKRISFLLAILMILLCVTPVFATEESDDIAAMCEYLKEQNVPEAFLFAASTNTIESLYDDFIQKGATVAGYSAETGQLENHTVLPSARLASIPDADFSMQLLITRTSDSGLDTFSLRIIYSWLDDDTTSQTKNPFYRLKQDGLMVNWNYNYLTYDENTFVYWGYAKNPSTNKSFCYTTTTNLAKAPQGGIWVMFDLNRDGYLYLSGEMRLDLIETASAPGSGATNISVEYAHAHVVWSNITVGVSATGATFSGTYKSRAVSRTVTL